MKVAGFTIAPIEDPYAAMVELCRRPLVYRAFVLSLQGVYQEELTIIRAIKSRFPHVEVYVAHTDGRASAVAEAMRLGADGIVVDGGVNRVRNTPQITPQTPPKSHPVPAHHFTNLAQEIEDPPHDEARADAPPDIEPTLTAEELRALLHGDFGDGGAR